MWFVSDEWTKPLATSVAIDRFSSTRHSLFTIHYSRVAGNRSRSTCAATWCPGAAVWALPAPQYIRQGCRRVPSARARPPNRCSPSPVRPGRLRECGDRRKRIPLRWNRQPTPPRAKLSHCRSRLRRKTGSHRTWWHKRTEPHRAARQQGCGRCGAWLGLRLHEKARNRLAPIIARRCAAVVQTAISTVWPRSFRRGSSAGAQPRWLRRCSPIWQEPFPPQCASRAP